MINNIETNIKLTRIEICDLLLACLAADELSNGNAKKWIKLHNKIKKQLNDIDKIIEK